MHLGQKCPKISEAKKKEGISVGLQITQPLEDQYFNTNLNSTEKSDWKAIEKVCRNFLGKEKRKIAVKL